MNDLDAVHREVGPDRPVCLGWSMGASIALAYSARHADQVSKLVLVDATPLLVATEDFPHAVPESVAQQLMESIQTDFEAGAREFVELLFPESGTGELEDWFHGITQRTTPDIALESVGNVGSDDFRPMLDRITVPTLILYGSQDQVCLPAASKYMHDRIDDSAIHEFPGKGHAPFVTDVESFNRRLQRFVSS